MKSKMKLKECNVVPIYFANTRKTDAKYLKTGNTMVYLCGWHSIKTGRVLSVVHFLENGWHHLFLYLCIILRPITRNFAVKELKLACVLGQQTRAWMLALVVSCVGTINHYFNVKSSKGNGSTSYAVTWQIPITLWQIRYHVPLTFYLYNILCNFKQVFPRIFPLKSYCKSIEFTVAIPVGA